MTDLQIFKNAPPDASAEELKLYLDGACGGDAALRARVEALFQAEAKAGGFMERPAMDAGPTVTELPSSPVREGPGTQIGRYKLLQEIGAGGFGVVYMAEQKEPVKRRVALKIIKVGMDTKQVVARFEAERQALALMDHSNIAKVLDAGATETGRPYFVMELVKGVRITEYCDENQLTTKERLELFIPVCQAIQHAHQKGIIHRDIKPSNVMVTLHDGVPVPKVIDFGIAKATQAELTEKTIFTQYGQFIGTPAYMSPEQAEMSGLDVDTRSDIYSLGVLLYELLVGRPPLDTKELLNSGFDEIRRRIKEEQPAKPSTRFRTLEGEEKTTAARHRKVRPEQLSSELRGDLDWIVLKALEKDRTRRYETANGLASDLKRHLSNDPVVARPPSAAYRFQKAWRRNRLVLGAAMVVFAALLVGIAVSTWQAIVATQARNRATLAETAKAQEARIAQQERDRALEAQARADAKAREARRNAYVANLNLAAQAYQDGYLDRVRKLLEPHVPQAGQEDLREFEWRLLWKQSRSDALASVQLPRAPIIQTILTPDGTKLITAQSYNQVRVFEPDTLRQIANFSTNVINIGLSGDGRTLAVLTSDALTQVFDLETLRERRTIFHPAERLVISPDGAVLALWDHSEITLWDARNGELKERISTRERPVSKATYYPVVFTASPDWSFFCTSDAEKIFVWDRAARSLAMEMAGHPGGTLGMCFSADGKSFGTGGWLDFQARVWNWESKNPWAVVTNHKAWVSSVAFSPDGQTFASASADHTVRLWDLKERKEKAVLRGHTDEVWSLAYSPDGERIVSGSRGGELSFWRARPRSPEPTLVEGDFLAASFAPDSRTLTTASTSGKIQRWDSATLRELSQTSVPVEGAASTILSQDGSMLAVGRTNGEIQLMDLANQRRLSVLSHGPGRAVIALRFSANGKVLASHGDGDGLRAWDTGKGTQLYYSTNLSVPNSFFRSAYALAPQGDVLAFETQELRLRIVNLATASERTFDPGLWRIKSLEFSPDGNQLAAAGHDHSVKLWRTSDYQELASVRYWRQAAHAIAFSPNSRRLAVTTGEGSTKLLDLATMQEVASFSQPGVAWMSFSPDGNSLAAKVWSGLQFWRAPSWEEIAAAEAKEKTYLKQP